MTKQPVIAKVIIFMNRKGEYEWRALTAGDLEPLPGKSYRYHTDCMKAAKSLFPDAEIEDQSV